MIPSFAVVIPMFNEQFGVEKCIAEVSKELLKISSSALIFAVNDGSTDSTLLKLNDLMCDYQNLRIISKEKNQGYGSALASGIKKAAEMKFEYVLFMDSDLTNQPSDIANFYLKMQQNVDVIKATRYSDGGRVVGVPIKRRLISIIANYVSRRLFGLPVSDPTNGFRAVRTSLIESTIFEEKGFAIIMEELYVLSGMQITYANVPVTLYNRNTDGRDSSFSYTPAQLLSYLKYPLMTFLNINRNKPSVLF
jgi:dolichol-phosphate mannosyltransferase